MPRLQVRACTVGPANQRPLRKVKRRRVSSRVVNRGVFPSLLSPEVDLVTREACERFAAGYIQCMHDVHTFVSTCPGFDPTVADELLNHLLESMPLRDEDRLRLMLPDTSTDSTGSSGLWPQPEGTDTPLVSPAPSTVSTDELGSDFDETESEQSHVSSSEDSDSHDALNFSSVVHKSMWRPW